ncbi:MAG: OmpA family protein [Bacteroidota bacterium]
MKTGKPLLFVLLAIILSSTTLFAQNQDAPGPERYVIVGVFKVLDNAVRFTDKANKLSFHAGYVQNPRNKLYYVYIFQSTESKMAFAFMMKVRLETEFKDAWVYRGSLGQPIVETPTTEITPEPKQQEPPKEEPKKEPVVEHPVIDPPKEEPKEVPTENPVITPPVETPKEPVVEEPKTDSTLTTTMEPKPVGKPFFFKLVSNDTGEPLVGEIHVFEPNSNSQNYQSFPSNQVVYLPAPRDPSQVYAITTLSAGYQEMDRAINYADPAASSAEIGQGKEFIIALPLVHVKLGDYIEFSNVRFFQNSVMLHPEAKEELDGLAELLKQNPRYKVTIHAHCNGTQDRNIIVRGNGQEFFGTSTGNQRKTVSAKELTELRATLVKDYLISQGVEGKRISSKGEGGAAIIYPVNSTLANRNDRVEIEVKRGK